MKPVDQTKFGKGVGNCMMACIASILEIPLEDVPEIELQYADYIERYYAWRAWFRSRGFGYLPFDVTEPDADVIMRWDGYTIGSGDNPDGISHAVVCYDEEVVHDPNPSRRGIVKITGMTVIHPLNPLGANEARETVERITARCDYYMDEIVRKAEERDDDRREIERLKALVKEWEEESHD